MAKKTPKDALRSFLDEHYFSEEVEELLTILNNLSLHEAFSKSVVQLRKTNDLRVIVSHILDSINSRLATASKPGKRKIEKVLIGLCYRILLDYFKASPLTAKQFVDILENSLRTTCKLKGGNFTRMSELFDFPRMRFTLEQIAKKVPYPNSPYFVWEKEGDLNVLIEELVDRRKIAESRSDFEKLFQYESHPNARVRWKREHDQLLVWLFSSLKDYRFITVRGKNALFVVIERQFVDFNNTPFRNKTLRNKCSAINKNGDDHKHITDDVESIISKIKLNGVQGH